MVQKFYEADIEFKKGAVFFEKDINEILEDFRSKFNLISLEHRLEDNKTTLLISVTGFPYYAFNCEVEPYHPATFYTSNGDPGAPSEGGVINYYVSTKEMLIETLQNSSAYKINVIYEEFDELNSLLSQIDEGNDDEDILYEIWKDKQLD